MGARKRGRKLRAANKRRKRLAKLMADWKRHYYRTQRELLCRLMIDGEVMLSEDSVSFSSHQSEAATFARQLRRIRVNTNENQR